MARHFPRVSILRRGYRPRDVNAFMLQASRALEMVGKPGQRWDDASIRGAAFRTSRRGYDPAAVDRALDKLEESFQRRARAHTLREGNGNWDAHAKDLAATLRPRLEREIGDGFAHPGFLRSGYAAEEVDDFLATVADHLDGGRRLTAARVREVTFSRARGSKAYEEAVVDAYLDRVVEVVLAGG